MKAKTKKKKSKRVCHLCVEESYLKAEIQSKGQHGPCSYCEAETGSYSIDELAKRVQVAFEQHFKRTPGHPTDWQNLLLSDPESDYNWERDGEEVVSAIKSAVLTSEEIASDLQAILDHEHQDLDLSKMGEETDFSSESHYEENEPKDYAVPGRWLSLEDSLKTEARFFNNKLKEHFAALFGGIDEIPTTTDRSLIVNAGPKTDLTGIFRARLFNDQESLLGALRRPDRTLGPPPAGMASNGRMNVHGISVFYGATDRDVAKAEVRPPVGSWVAIARFDIIQPLRLLDLTALETVNVDGSIFDPSFVTELARISELRQLRQLISIPAIPGNEAGDYLLTQAIAEFLANQNQPSVDGILFPSAQVAALGPNVVLFQKAARVSEMKVPESAKIEARLNWEEDNRFYISVSEVLPSTKPEKSNKKDENREHALDSFDTQAPALSIAAESIEVHRITSVQFESNLGEVKRIKYSEDGIPF